MVGMGSDRVDLDLFRVQSHELRIEGLFRYVDTWPTAIALVSSGRVEVASLVSDVVGLDDLDAAMRRNGDPDVMKIVVRV